MSTHAEVFFERADGSVTGTYVHFDGYPDVCGAGMAVHSYETISKAILKAQAGGGLRFIGPDKIECYEDRHACVISDLGKCRERYVYVKNRDGSVDMVSGAGSGRVSRSRLSPPVSNVTPHELAAFLERECGSRCLDDEGDLMAVVTAILDEYHMARK